MGEVGQAALHMAVSTGSDSIVRLLCNVANVDLDIQDSDKMTPLHLAAEMGRESAIHILIDAGADVLLRNNLGHTAADLAASCGHHQVVDLLEAARNRQFLNSSRKRPRAESDAALHIPICQKTSRTGY